MVPPTDASGGPVQANAGTPSIWSDVSSAFGSLFGTAAKTAAQSGSIAIQKSIQGSINPPPRGLSTTTLLVGGVLAAYFYTRK